MFGKTWIFLATVTLNHVLSTAFEPPFRFTIPFFAPWTPLQKKEITPNIKSLTTKKIISEIEITTKNAVHTSENVREQENNKNITSGEETTISENTTMGTLDQNKVIDDTKVTDTVLKNMHDSLVQNRDLPPQIPCQRRENSCELPETPCQTLPSDPCESAVPQTPPQMTCESRENSCELPETPCQTLPSDPCESAVPQTPPQMPCESRENSCELPETPCHTLPSDPCESAVPQIPQPSCQNPCCPLKKPCQIPNSCHPNPCYPPSKDSSAPCQNPDHPFPHPIPQNAQPPCQNPCCPLKKPCQANPPSYPSSNDSPPPCQKPCSEPQYPSYKPISSGFSRFFKSLSRLFNIHMELEIPVTNECDYPKIRLRITEGKGLSDCGSRQLGCDEIDGMRQARMRGLPR